MKIVQVNGWLGRLNAPLARFVTKEQPDLLCMQEAFNPEAMVMDVFKDQYGFVDELIKVGGFNYHFFAPAWAYEMGGQKLEVGNIILSKFPLKDLQAFHTHGQYHLRSVNKAISNTRIWQSCVVTAVNGQSLSLANYQGYLTGADSNGDEMTLETMQKVRDALGNLPRPLIFCGDLNINPSSEGIRVLDGLGLKNLTAEYHIASTLSSAHRAPQQARDSVAVDYIFVSPEVQVRNFRVSDELVSDHKALILEFKI